MNISSKHIVVIGAGPAGLMATGSIASAGGDVVLLEKMKIAGRKLRITGKGRCNLTNQQTMQEFLTHFKPKGHFLRTALSGFFVEDLIQFFQELDVEVVVERGHRVFPKSGKAVDVVNGLLQWVNSQGINIQCQTTIKKLIIEEGCVMGVETFSGKRIDSKAVIIATGGLSYPATGSTGDGYRFAERAGHKISQTFPALVPLETEETFDGRLDKLNLKNVSLSSWCNGKKVDDQFGEMSFTRFGITGPVVLTMSRQIVESIMAGKDIHVLLDLKPALDHQVLDKRLLSEFKKNNRKKLTVTLKTLLPQKLIPICLEMTGISPEKTGDQITSEERKQLRLWLKEFKMIITGYRPFSEAIITAGGVNTKEIDPKTMASRKIKGLYFAGEVLNFDADTGGYNLQAAFSTGRLAGLSALDYIKNHSEFK